MTRKWRISLGILMQTGLVIWMTAGQLQATYLNWVELLSVGEAKNNLVWHYLQLKQNTWHWQVQHKKLYGCNVFKMISMKPQLNQHSYMRITNQQYAWRKIHNIMDEQNVLTLSSIISVNKLKRKLFNLNIVKERTWLLICWQKHFWAHNLWSPEKC